MLYNCSLLKIETAQEPLSKQELNMRLLTQSLVTEATNRVEFAADSIISTTANTNLQKQAYRWKIETLNTFKNTAFQSSPKLSLMDTWTYMLQVRNFMKTSAAHDYFGDYTDYVAQVAQENVEDIEKKAQQFFTSEAFLKHQDFASKFAADNPISSANLKHNPVRSTDAAGKQFKWNTELMLKEKGFDSVQIKDVMATVEMKIDRLSDIAENTPDKLHVALKYFSTDMRNLFYALNSEIGLVSERMALERQAIDTIIRRERIALDSIILRERKAVAFEASEISVRVVDEAMIHIKDLTGTILFYIVLLFAVLLFLPFLLGYFAGKIHQKNKHQKQKD